MTPFLSAFEKSEEFIRLSRSAGTPGAPVGAIGVPAAGKAAVISALCEKLNKKAFILTPDEASAVRMYENLSALQSGVLLYPKREFTFLEVEGISREYEQLRLGVLSNIVSENYTAVVASVGAAVQYTMPPAALQERTFTISTGDDIDLEDITNRLVKAGYTRFDEVDGTAQFAELWLCGDVLAGAQIYDAETQIMRPVR